MKKHALISMVFLLVGSAAFAADADKTTEFFIQPSAGQNVIRGDYYYSFSTGSFDAAVAGDNNTISTWGKDYQVTYAYGLNNSWALGAVLTYGQNNVEIVPQGSTGQSSYSGLSGLYDLVLVAHNTTPMGSWNLHYGADLNYSLGNGKYNTRANEGTNQSGGYGLRPYVGASYDTGMGWVGGTLGYWWKGTRNVDPQAKGYSGKDKQGNVTDLNAFYEYHGDIWMADFKVGFKFMEEDYYSITNSSGVEAMTVRMQSHTNSYVAVGGNFYWSPVGMVRVAYEADMMPSYQWSKDYALTSSSRTNNVIDIAARYAF